MKKVILLISLVILLSSCWNKTKEVTVEPIVTTWAIEEINTQNKSIVATWSNEEVLNIEEKRVIKEELSKETKKEETPTQPKIVEKKIVEKKKVETKTPAVKTQIAKEETTPKKTVDHEPTTPVADEWTDELIDDMIGDIDDIFKEIESDG